MTGPFHVILMAGEVISRAPLYMEPLTAGWRGVAPDLLLDATPPHPPFTSCDASSAAYFYDHWPHPVALTLDEEQLLTVWLLSRGLPGLGTRLAAAPTAHGAPGSRPLVGLTSSCRDGCPTDRCPHRCR